MTTQLAPDRFGLPPPLELDLVDAGRPAGWIAGNAVGFRGFGDEAEATHAAWVAHRALARRLARTHGLRPVPIDIEPLALHKVARGGMILASGKPIATLVRPGPESRSGVDSFGFELQVPAPVTELEARAMAYLMYRTLRKSGLRWAMWRPEAPQVGTAATVRAGVKRAGAAGNADATTPNVTRWPAGAPWPLTVPTRRSLPRLTTFGLTVLALAAVLGLGVTPFVTIALTALLVAATGVGGLILFRSRRPR
jgi:hypothetical protein